MAVCSEATWTKFLISDGVVYSKQTELDIDLVFKEKEKKKEKRKERSFLLFPPRTPFLILSKEKRKERKKEKES